jgi:hypothetical protein
VLDICQYIEIMLLIFEEIPLERTAVAINRIRRRDIENFVRYEL